jgi:hypothetical protein
VKDRNNFNPNGVVPRSHRRGATPLGLFDFYQVSQGSSFLATLGFEAESLWDSALQFPELVGVSFEQINRDGNRLMSILHIGPPDEIIFCPKVKSIFPFSHLNLNRNLNLPFPVTEKTQRLRLRLREQIQSAHQQHSKSNP